MQDIVWFKAVAYISGNTDVVCKLKNDSTCNLYLPILIDSCFVFCQTELGGQIQEVINQGPCNFVVDFAA